MISFRRKPQGECSEEIRESAARTAAMRAEVESRWPQILELVTFSEGRMIENHIGQAITESMFGSRRPGRHTA